MENRGKYKENNSIVFSIMYSFMNNVHKDKHLLES